MCLFLFVGCKPTVNGCVVVTAYAECTGCKHLAVLDVSLSAFLVQDIEQYTVFSLRGNDDDVLEVLGSGTDQ